MRTLQLLALFAAPVLAGGSPAAAGQVTNTLPVTLGVQPGCALLTRPLVFVAPSATAAVVLDATANLTITCTPNTDFAITIDRGLNGTLLVNRRMVSASTGATVVYDVYRDPARLLAWGATTLTDVNGNSGLGAPLDVPIYGRVPAAALIAAGDYQDTLTVSLAF